MDMNYVIYHFKDFKIKVIPIINVKKRKKKKKKDIYM